MAHKYLGRETALANAVPGTVLICFFVCVVAYNNAATEFRKKSLPKYTVFIVVKCPWYANGHVCATPLKVSIGVLAEWRIAKHGNQDGNFYHPSMETFLCWLRMYHYYYKIQEEKT